MLNTQNKRLTFCVMIIALFHEGRLISNKTYHIPSIKTNWHKANEFCNSIGMRLVTIQSQAKNDAIAAFVKTTDKFNDVNSEFWIGGSDLAEEGTFTWMNTGQLVKYVNWSPNEPNNAFESEDCMELVYIPRFEQVWSWNDNNCETKKSYFICEGSGLECITHF
ncbi:C-type lectin 37Da-like [Wyeomyia smithii]|uniref:C-type lectin 37Da-like n=1 Tax=Wyeomyia smithii TaxID=174621 RepID=UPI0024681CAA|nr:C-type lectin 37Da-like [Wyeomyia smithii]